MEWMEQRVPRDEKEPMGAEGIEGGDVTEGGEGTEGGEENNGGLIQSTSSRKHAIAPCPEAASARFA